MKPGRKPGSVGLKRLSKQTPVPIAPRSVSHFYNHDVAEIVADAYLQGKGLMQIAALSNMPSYGTLLRWMRDIPEFRAKLQAANEVRAQHFFEMAMEVGTQPLDKSEVPGASLNHQAYKWGAEVSDPSTFGKQTKVTGDAQNPLRIVVESGLNTNTVDEVYLDERGLITQKPSGAV